MPNRILKESIRVSESIDKLSWFEEVLFYRLIVSCDDFGRYDGRPAIIKNMLFPLKENLTLQTVQKAINNLASAELVVLYEFEGKPYLHLPGWNEHQTVRAKKSKYPAPEDGVETSASICKQMQADVPVIQSNTESNSISESESNSERTGAFDRFWEAYPKKVGKEAARSAFRKIKGVSIETLLLALGQQKNSDQWKKENGRFIPNPATWLNQGRWEDEMTILPQAKAPAEFDYGDLDRLYEEMVGNG